MTPIDANKGSNINNNNGLNNNACYGFYFYGNCPNNVDTRWNYFVNSNNGEILEDGDELNYQKSKINSNETTSTMKWKIQTRRSDMNNEYNKETIDVCNTKTRVVVQVIMPNDH